MRMIIVGATGAVSKTVVDALSGRHKLIRVGSVTNRDPIPSGSCAAAANGALDGFVKGAAVDMPRGNRINAVSPEVLESCHSRTSTR